MVVVAHRLGSAFIGSDGAGALWARAMVGRLPQRLPWRMSKIGRVLVGLGGLPGGAYGGMYISHSLSSSVDKVLDADDRDVSIPCGLGFSGL